MATQRRDWYDRTWPLFTVDRSGAVNLRPEQLSAPYSWRKPAMVLLPDLARPEVPAEFTQRALTIAREVMVHTYLLATEHAERMQRALDSPWWTRHRSEYRTHVWAGVQLRSQEGAEERIPHLMRTPAAIRWVLLTGRADVSRWLAPVCGRCNGTGTLPFRTGTIPCIRCSGTGRDPQRLSWVVARLRPGRSNGEYLAQLRDQCEAGGVPLYIHGTLPDGSLWRQFPDEIGHILAGLTLQGRRQSGSR